MKPYIVSNSNDEYLTPEYAVTPILEFVPTGATVWCPFDMEDSQYVVTLRKYGCKVFASHIRNGQNFFDYLPKRKFDYIISNPPFSKKTEVLAKLYEIGKPFAMLLPINSLFCSQKRFSILKKHGFEMMVFDKRIRYFSCEKQEVQKGSPPFISGYVTKGMFKQTIVFRELKMPA